MTMATLQRHLARICLDPAPQPADLDALYGEDNRWLVYRHMARFRLETLLRKVIPRTVQALGDPAFEYSFTRYLADQGPRSRFLRDVAIEFIDCGLISWRKDPTLPAYLVDLAQYERARWHAGIVAAEFPAHLVPFEFDKPALLNPTCHILNVRYGVHQELSQSPAKLSAVQPLCIFRHPLTHAVQTWQVNDLSADLITTWMPGNCTAAQGVRLVARARGLQMNPGFLEALSDVLAKFIEQGIILAT